jgi:DnaK suppressor protein
MQMIVSILQLMGFASGKPIQSRADSDSRASASLPARADKVAAGGGTKKGQLPVRDPEPAQAIPSRRPEVKTQPASKAKTKVTTAKPKPMAAKVVKAGVKPSAKVAPKAVAKPAVKSAARAVPVKAPAKVAPKVAKTAAKPAVRAAAPVKAAPVKSSPKKPAEVKVATKATGKKSTTPVVPKTTAKPAQKAQAAPPLPVKPQKKEIPQLSNLIISADKKAVKPELENPVVVAPVSAQSAVPVRSGRVSSRLAQLTVPSMAATPAVASTAAKASYGPSTDSALPTPPHFVPVKKDAKLANNWKTKPVAQWTDEEVVAMPDTEYMNEGQMAFFRLKLMQLKRDILANAGETTEHLREETVVVPDPADRATIEEEHALELRTRDRERKLLKKIEQSIGRIDAGDYGYCDETGEAIGVSRLLARPTATLSLEAQQRRELKQKMFGD